MFLLLFFLIFLTSTPGFCQMLYESPDQVWEVGDRRWTVEEEYRFGKWVEEEINEDFFIHHNLPTDCADAVYAIRWIYSRIHRLPAAATTTEDKFIGHWSTDWKHFPTDPEWHKDKRFRAVLLSLFPRIRTGTLPQDTYPIRISPDSVTPGTLFLVTESHTGMIRQVSLDGSHAHPLLTWESALPVKVQKLSPGYFFAAKPELISRSGLVKFRWPIFKNGEWKYLPDQEHPFYSEEQYQPDFYRGDPDFVKAVARRIDPKTYDSKEKMIKLMGTITRFLKERVPIVLTGYRECSSGGCQRASDLWESHHTSGRDGMIVLMMDHLSEMIASDHLEKKMAKERMKGISIDISEKRSVTFYDVYQSYLWLSSDPGESIEARWGLEKCRMIHDQTCSAQSSIAFIERTYRKKDPVYADFSVGQQERILRRLEEEWKRFECREASATSARPARIVSRPEGSIEARSKPKSCGKIRSEIRATYDSIAFIERTYRKKDPEYAEFSIRQQKRILERLDEEWNRLQCQYRTKVSSNKD